MFNRTTKLFCGVLCTMAILFSMSASMVIAGPKAKTAKAKTVKFKTVKAKPKLQNNGYLDVYVLQGHHWQKAGSMNFGKKLATKSMNIGHLVTNDKEDIKIKFVKVNGGAGHLDAVFLGNDSPIAVDGEEGLPLDKVSFQDNDLISIGDKGTEFTFDRTNSNWNLLVTARIENVKMSKLLFHFPLIKIYESIKVKSDSYNYKMDSREGSLEFGEKPEELSFQPLFKEYCRPGSEYPNGYTYGWVMNDHKYLYALIDFTSDNTMDDEKDYATMYVKTSNGLREFKLSEADQLWGKPYFAYTDHVKYQHRVYQFKIPLKELEISDSDHENLSIAFVASTGRNVP